MVYFLKIKQKQKPKKKKKKKKKSNPTQPNFYGLSLIIQIDESREYS